MTRMTRPAALDCARVLLPPSALQAAWEAPGAVEQVGSRVDAWVGACRMAASM